MSGPGRKPPPPRAYPNFVAFADRWLFPLVAVRLGEANREGTYTWCSQWWAHRAVSVRIAALHEAFEAARAQGGAAVSTFVTRHVDSHMRTILDAANGPLHRCNRTHHTPHPSLTADPVPPGWFDYPANRSESSTERANQTSPLRFPTVDDFVQQWLLPVVSVRLAGNGRDGNYTWCRQWWRHHGPSVRLALIHRAFEIARRSDDTTAYSTLFVDHIDPHMAVILAAGDGPLHRCTPEQHNDLSGLTSERPPVNWFATGGPAPLEELGFGPDYRPK
ncbi:DUF4913 domain-containing protein [Nocardia farcinica]|uniref:DUF4913 domain-containing protein n=1 Tax=Nocardia farcinica TaxID=37329 RepID=UPI000E0628DD|nr:DUF4913 domain-containing protein [Nocardia farcinica]SUE27729.1 Uncharacterised protein [Nocardia farcinica]